MINTLNNFNFDPIMIGLINTLGSWYFKNRYRSIQECLIKTSVIQQQTFYKLIKEGKETTFGKIHGFQNIKSYADFKTQLPIVSYEEFFPYIDQMLEGGKEICWPTAIQWFAKSSGTTNDKSKFIPVSFETLEQCHFEAGKDVLSIHFQKYPNSLLFEGKGLLIGGSNQKNPLNDKASYGDLSAVLMNEMPYWAHLAKTPDLDIALMDNWDEKLVKMAETTSKENVTSISGVPTWTIVILKKVLEITGKTSIKEVWPNLELYIHGGISFVPYKKQFNEIMGHNRVHFIETYNASEGFFGIQTNNEPWLTLMPNYGIFYEFLNQETQEVCDINGIVLNINYELIISTNSGLWRYRIGDTILFKHMEPYQFIITGRTKHFINAFGEELMVHNADTALDNTCKKHHIALIDYTAAPLLYENMSQLGTHQWLIQLNKLPDSAEDFYKDLDLELQAQNTDYAAKRAHNLAMGFPKIELTTVPVFYNWLNKKSKLGGQHKVPRLSNDRKILEEIIANQAQR